jgi:hypothetical protein
LGFSHALLPGKIALRAYVTKAAHYKLARNVARLRRAVLEEEPAAAREVRGAPGE